MKTFFIYIAFWFGLVVVAIINGAVREKVYGPLMSELSAHQLSTLIGLVLFGIYIWILTGAYPMESSRQAIAIGGTWLVMTVIFEFVFGHWVMKHPWQRLFHDYNIFQGRVWLLVLIWTAIAPSCFYVLRNGTKGG